ncbi:hypothetical protein Ahy_B01g055364 [Arachis hypogaea]|uniref:Aminotransferase-like plant mobile domain-containing protein n=1 Tax=Arachis hypogaea TaxID=3818 RepID=A0A445AVZ3_ARAHY|nr:hypothetical protein Ahy_B01g055364 [Arachis hypogaea]
MYYKSLTHLISHKTHVRCRWSGYNPSGSNKGPRVHMWRLRIDMLQDREFIWMLYSRPEVLQVVHPEALEPRHTALWRSVTSLIYFAVIEWHQIDRVLPQFGGVQPRPHPALNIDFLMSKDGRGGDRWFPYALQSWHLHWESRADTVLRFDLLGYEHEMYRLDQVEALSTSLGGLIEQSQTKWTVMLTWFHNTVCGELEQDATEERLMRYTRGYIMQLIGGILFPDASLGCISGGFPSGGPRCMWPVVVGFGCAGMAVLPDVPGHGAWSAQLGRMLRPDGVDAHRFPLVKRWVQYRPDNATGESRLRQYRRTLNGIGMMNLKADASAAVVCPLLCFAIVEWHQVDQHIPTRPLNIDDMHRLDGRFGYGEWFPHLLGGWHEMWDARADYRLPIYHHIDLRPSLPYMTWYLQWAHTELFGLGDQHLVPAGVVPEDLPIHHPLAPDLHQPEDGHLSELRPAAGGGRGRGWGRGRGRGRRGGGRGKRGSPQERPCQPAISPCRRCRPDGWIIASRFNLVK